MATVYSDQLTTIRAGRNIRTADQYGRARALWWNFAALPVGNIGDILVLGKMMAGERLLVGREVHSAGGAGTFNIGTYLVNPDGISLGAVETANLFTATALSAAVGTNFFGVLVVGDVPADPLAGDRWLCITNVGTAFTTSARFTGAALLVGSGG